MSDLAWMFVAFATVWLAIGGYLIVLGVRQKRLERDLQRLQGSAQDQDT